MGPATERAHHAVQLAIAGYGRMGKLHCATAEAMPAVTVTGIVDPHICGGRKAQGMPSVSALQDLPLDEVDAVIVASPTATHDALVQQALELGKHVLCEKPLTLDARRDAALGRLAAERGLVLQVGFWRRFAEPFRALRSLLEAGRIGHMKAIRTSQWDAAPPSAEFCAPHQSGGIEIDCGVHEFDLAAWLFKVDVVSVVACAAPAIPELAAVGDVDTVLGLARLSGDICMTVDLARTAGGLDSIRAEVLGSAGAIIVEFADTGTITIRTHAEVEHVALQTTDVVGDAIRSQLQAFLAAVKAGEASADSATAADSRRALVAAQRLQAARRAGTWDTAAGIDHDRVLDGIGALR